MPLQPTTFDKCGENENWFDLYVFYTISTDTAFQLYFPMDLSVLGWDNILAKGHSTIVCDWTFHTKTKLLHENHNSFNKGKSFKLNSFCLKVKGEIVTNELLSPIACPRLFPHNFKTIHPKVFFRILKFIKSIWAVPWENQHNWLCVKYRPGSA